MPAKHRYRCLNPACPGPGHKDYTDLFRALNVPQPTCPACGSIKLEDWGEWPGGAGWIRIASPGVSADMHALNRQTDSDMRRIAERHGLTNMSNRDGRAVKSYSATDAKGEFGHIRLPGGVMAPVDYTPKCSNVALTSVPLKLETGARFAGKPATMRSVPTKVIAEHKGAA